ncbi:MAG: hypothetical protein HPY76_13920 [Anaerolineae bacterium]|nr:hypothetical protein [Anaerolineae bacterium]
MQVLDADPALEFNNPIWSPDGKWIASTARYINSGNDQQLVLIDAQTYDIQWITQDARYTHSSHQWSPASDALVYQRFELGSSQFEPEIWLWDMETGASRLVSEQAGMPRWLP